MELTQQEAMIIVKALDFYGAALCKDLSEDESFHKMSKLLELIGRCSKLEKKLSKELEEGSNGKVDEA